MVPTKELRSADSFWVSGVSPALASVGKQIEAGHSFVWPAGGTPYIVTAWGTRVNLVVDERIPYLVPGSKRCAPRPIVASDLVVPSPASLPAGAVVAESTVHDHSLHDSSACDSEFGIDLHVHEQKRTLCLEALIPATPVSGRYNFECNSTVVAAGHNEGELPIQASSSGANIS